jgi:hypothetical protein
MPEFSNYFRQPPAPHSMLAQGIRAQQSESRGMTNRILTRIHVNATSSGAVLCKRGNMSCSYHKELLRNIRVFIRTQLPYDLHFPIGRHYSHLRNLRANACQHSHIQPPTVARRTRSVTEMRLLYPDAVQPTLTPISQNRCIKESTGTLSEMVCGDTPGKHVYYTRIGQCSLPPHAQRLELRVGERTRSWQAPMDYCRLLHLLRHHRPRGLCPAPHPMRY